jgi:hypothetical protein
MKEYTSPTREDGPADTDSRGRRARSNLTGHQGRIPPGRCLKEPGEGDHSPERKAWGKAQSGIETEGLGFKPVSSPFRDLRRTPLELDPPGIGYRHVPAIYLEVLFKRM